MTQIILELRFQLKLSLSPEHAPIVLLSPMDPHALSANDLIFSTSNEWNANNAQKASFSIP